MSALTISNVGKMFDNYGGDIARIAIPGLDLNRFEMGILQTFRKQPALLKCNPETIKTAIYDASAVGVIPGVGERPLGYLIAYGPDCQFQLSVYGRIYLMRKYAGLTALRWRPVFEGDLFTVDYNNLGTFWNHVPKATETTAEKLTHVWVEGTFKGADGIERTEFHYVSRADIERVRQKSRQKDVGPWKNDYIPMAVKTAINQFAKDKQNSPIVSGALRREELRETRAGSQWDIDGEFLAEEGDAVSEASESGALPGLSESNPAPTAVSTTAKAIAN